MDFVKLHIRALRFRLYESAVTFFFSRAMSKVQQLVTDHKLEETKRIKTAKSLRKHMPIRKDELDQLLSTVQGRDVTKEQEDRWSETLKEQLDIECPCKVC